MALTADQLSSLRRVIAEPTETTYTDEILNSVYSEEGTIAASAARIWAEKAAAAATLVDVTEGGSSRRMSQAAASYREMSAMWAARATDSTSTGRRTGSRPMERA